MCAYDKYIYIVLQANYSIRNMKYFIIHIVNFKIIIKPHYFSLEHSISKGH